MNWIEERIMYNKQWKDVFNAALTLNFQLLEAVQETEACSKDGKITPKKGSTLRGLFIDLRKKLINDEELTTADILILGIAMNIAQTSNKNKLAAIQAAVNLYDDIALPAFKELGTTPTYEQFCEKFADPIV
jgi:hypothetical protein